MDKEATAPQLVHKVPEPELQIRFTDLLDQYEGTISELRAILEPVLINGGVDVPRDRPEEAPFNDLHNRILRLERLNLKLNEVVQLIKL